MSKKTLRRTVSQMDTASPLPGQPSRDHAALILPISAIKLGENIRRDIGNFDELAASIVEHGILQPLVIAKTERGLELIAGFRRLEAAKLAGLVEVPVRVVNADENQIAVLRLVENLMRENLSGAEEIAAVARLAAIFPDQVQLAKAIGKSKSYVSRCLSAAEIVKTEGVATSQLTKSALFELADAKDPKASLCEVKNDPKPTVRSMREKSGPLPGGRYVQSAIQFRENQRTHAWSLRVNFDPERTPSATKDELIKRLQEILVRLTGENKS